MATGAPRGRSRSSISRLSWAQRALERLRRDCPDESLLHARVLLTLAYQMSELGDPARSTALLDEAEALHPAATYLVEMNRGLLQVRIGRTAEAIRHFDLAITRLARRRSRRRRGAATRLS